MLLAARLIVAMDLKFTFAKSTPPAADGQAGKAANLTGSGATQLPLNSASRNLFVEVLESAEDARAVAVSGDGVNYGSAEKPLGANPASAYRSVIARVIAEVGEPLSGSISALKLSISAYHALASAEEFQGGAFAPDGTVSQALQLRTGLSAGTRVELLDTL